MKRKIFLFMSFTLLVIISFCDSGNNVQFVQKENQIDVMFHGKLFTTYLYSPELAKPILYPLYSPTGIFMTRHFPPKKDEGETADHPHHTGIFFTYDEVNDSYNRENRWHGYWGNTTATPPFIKHIEVTEMTAGKGQGVLSTILHWIGRDGKVHLEEQRTMVFYPGKTEHIIDFTMQLTAKDTSAVFHDTKEGMFAIRFADWLREKDGTGQYLSSNGDEMEANVWGKRAKWVRLEGEKDGKKLGIAILNHPSSTNYPTYWHARGYGLFAANPLGQYAFQKSHEEKEPQEFKLTLAQGESALFKFRLIVYEGPKTKEQLDAEFEKY